MTESSIIIAGVDPGFFGAIAKIDPITHTIEIVDMPFFEIKTGQKTKKVLDHISIGDALDDTRIFHVYIEEVSARPGEGTVSSFSFGRNYGTIFGVCGGLKLPITQVRPQKWKSELKIPADKDATRYRASQYFPQCAHAWKLKKHDGRAEAALIAFYGMCQMGYKVSKPFTLIESEK